LTAHPEAHRPRSSRKLPITEPAHLRAVLRGARRLSPEHLEVVVILYRTGIEVKALSKVTWRDFVQGELIWKRRRRRDDVHIPIGDPDLAETLRAFISRRRRSSDQLDRLIAAAFRESRVPELARASPITLRLTRCWLELGSGRSPDEVARTLALPSAVVRELSALPPPSDPALWGFGSFGPEEE